MLGVSLSSLMRVPRDQLAGLAATALQRISAASLDDQRKYLLAECVQAYVALDPAGQAEFERLIGTSEFQGAKAMNKTMRELGREEGRELGREEGFQQGEQEGYRKLLTRQLRKRFGPLPELATRRLQAMSESELAAVGDALLDARSLDDLGLGPTPPGEEAGS